MPDRASLSCLHINIIMVTHKVDNAMMIFLTLDSTDHELENWIWKSQYTILNTVADGIFFSTISKKVLPSVLKKSRKKTWTV